ncbi:MAG: PP2C family protein-serine/threonine phosphatase [Candidatus Brocadiia bacterium]
MSKRIIFANVEDESALRLREYLEAGDYRLEEFSSCDRVRERIASGDIDLLILGVPLPDGSEEDVCSDLHDRPSTAGVPIIALFDSEEYGDDFVEKALEMGADEVLQKPLRRPDVLMRTRMLLRFKELNDDLRERNESLRGANQELSARNQELEQGMEMAHRLQQTLLPQEYPDVKNVSFTHLYTPADVIGGDIFQIAGMSDNRAVIFLSDVSGHGIRAALVTSILKAVFEHINLTDKTVTEILKDLNSRFRNIMGGLSPHIFATGFLMIIDGQHRSVNVASAGHVCPFLVSKFNKSCEPLMEPEETGPALGFFADPEFPTISRDLSSGDIVLGFTDGVYEVVDAEGQMYGLDRLRQFIARHARLVPRDLIEKIVRETEEFRGVRKRPDDVCLVAVEVH